MKHMFLALLIGMAATLSLRADEPNEAADGPEGEAAATATEAPATPPATGVPEPVDPLDRTMQELQDLRQDAAPAEPVRRPDLPGVQYAPTRVGAPAVSVDIDRSVLGVAPGQPQPTLKREGEFIVNRRGRLVRSPDGAHVLFQFEADSAQAQEAPMVMQACRNLEAMEDYVAERGDTAVFVVSGQVHVYRGANYLLPTMWKLAYDQGNLQH